MSNRIQEESPQYMLITRDESADEKQSGGENEENWKYWNVCMRTSLP